MVGDRMASTLRGMPPGSCSRRSIPTSERWRCWPAPSGNRDGDGGEQYSGGKSHLELIVSAFTPAEIEYPLPSESAAPVRSCTALRFGARRHGQHPLRQFDAPSELSADHDGYRTYVCPRARSSAAHGPAPTTVVRADPSVDNWTFTD